MKLRRQSDQIAIELIRSLFEGFLPSAIMSAGFVACGLLMVRASGDRTLAMLLAIGAFLSVLRLTIAWNGYRASRAPDLSIGHARRLEWRMGASYLAFAFLFGLFGARARCC